MMTVKKSGLVILNPVTPANKKCLSSQRESAELIWAVTGGGTFSNADHLLALREERRDGHKTRDDDRNTKIKDLVVDLD